MLLCISIKNFSYIYQQCIFINKPNIVDTWNITTELQLQTNKCSTETEATAEAGILLEYMF